MLTPKHGGLSRTITCMPTNPRARNRAVKPNPPDVHGALLAVDDADLAATSDGVPEPSAIKAVWFPAIIQVPGEEPRYKGKAYATPEGLYVYWGVPPQTEPGVENWAPDWYAEIDFEKTKRPPTGWAARNGFVIHTTKGRVVITMEGGCGCHSPLKRWSPQFAQRMVSW